MKKNQIKRVICVHHRITNTDYFLYELYSEMSQYISEIHILTAQNEIQEFEKLKNVFLYSIDAYNLDKFSSLPAKLYRKLFRRHYVLASFRRAIIQYTKQLQPELIHGNAIIHAMLTMGDKATLPPIVTTVHGSLEKVRRSIYGNLLPKDKLFSIYDGFWTRKWEKNSLDIADSIICVSRSTQDIVSDLYGNYDNINVIHNGINNNRIKPLECEVIPNSVLFIGRMSKEKGLDTLLKAFQLVKEQVDNATLYIVGGGDNSEYENLAHELNIRKVTTFYGRVPNIDIPTVINRHEIGVLPSLLEGHPISLIEMMACRKAVIASGVGGILEVIINERNGLLVKPGDSRNLANKLILLLRNKKLQEKLANEGYGTVKEKFTIKHQAGNITNVYSKSIYREIIKKKS